MNSRYVLFVAVALLSSPLGAVRGQGADRPSPQLFPIPVRVEHQQVPSGMYLRINALHVARQLESISELPQAGPTKASLTEYFGAIASRNENRFRSLVVADNANASHAMFAALTSVIPSSAKISIDYEFFYDASTLISASVSSGGGTNHLVTTLFVDDGRTGRFSIKEMGGPLFQVVSSVARAIDSDPKMFSPRSALDHFMSVSISGGDMGLRSNPVAVEFRGSRMPPVTNSSKGITGEHVPENSVSAALNFICETKRLFIANDDTAVLDRCGVASRQKMSSLLANPKLASDYRKQVRQLGMPTVAVQGDELIVFLVTGKVKSKQDETVLHIDEVKVSPDGKMVVVNLLQEGPFERLFYWPEFANPFFKALAQGGR